MAGTRSSPSIAYMPVSVMALLSAWLLAAQTSAEKPPGYAGSALCQICHGDIYNAFQKNPHVILERDKKRGWEEKACESCHGPGAKHAETASAEEIRNPRKLRPAEADRTCLRCHLNQRTYTGRIQSSHAKNLVSCAACHSVHQNREALLPQRASDINAQCSGCHFGLGRVPAPRQTPPAGRRDVLCGLS